MTYHDFVCECVMRLGAVITPETGKPSLPPKGCLIRALELAEILMKERFISLPFQLLIKKFSLYNNALETAFEARTKETEKQVFYGETTPRFDPSRLKEMTEAIQSYIAAKNDFYIFAHLSVCELAEESCGFEDKKSSAISTISSIGERLLSFFENSALEKRQEQEQELVDTGALFSKRSSA
jgi:hypothetical protein